MKFQKWSEIKKKSGKISKNYFFQKIFSLKFFSSKKSFSISFLILGGRDFTRALHSSPFQIAGGVV